MLRLAPNTQVRFVELNPGSRQMQLGAGTVDLAELQGADGGAQIETPSVTVRPNQSGDYRVSVTANGQTFVTARSGSATVGTGTGSQTITPGSTLVAYGPYANPSISLQGAIGYDSFDQFNISRDQSIASAYNANPYLSPQLAGYSNLANYGSWQNVPGYGWAWAPNNQNQNNFAPYQNGQWAWEPASGYTWVDNAPYGYPTTHYGSWFNNPSYGGWLWQPPGYQYQTSSSALSSAWLPAVVSFFITGGSGADTSGLLNGFSGLTGPYADNTDIGWIPLAPGEQYQPWYGQNYSYPSTALTPVPNVTNIYNYYSNAQYYRGVTMVPVSAWRTGNFRHLSVVRPQQLHQIYLIRGSVPVVPTTENLHYSATRVSNHVALSHTFEAQRFAAKPAAAARASFTAQQEHIKTIAAAKPSVVSLPEHHTVTRPVYNPVKRPPVHVTAMKPVTHTGIEPKHEAHAQAAPKNESHAATAPKPVEQVKTQAKPVVHEEKPAFHETPAERSPSNAVPRAKPVTHPAPTIKPVTTPVPEAKPVAPKLPAQAPTVHNAAPAAQTHPAPPAKPVTPATPRPTPHSSPLN